MTQKYQVKVSMKQAAIVETGIVLKQGDFGMQIEIEVLDFDATGTTPQIVFRKAMGAVESTTITVSSNKYTYTFKGTELDTPGKVFCDLKLKNSTTQRISTASFMFKVVADTLDGLAEEAGSYSDTIEQLLADVVHLSDTPGLVKNDGSINTTIEDTVTNQGNQINDVKKAFSYITDCEIIENKTYTASTKSINYTFLNAIPIPDYTDKLLVILTGSSNVEAGLTRYIRIEVWYTDATSDISDVTDYNIWTKITVNQTKTVARIDFKCYARSAAAQTASTSTWDVLVISGEPKELFDDRIDDRFKKIEPLKAFVLTNRNAINEISEEIGNPISNTIIWNDGSINDSLVPVNVPGYEYSLVDINLPMYIRIRYNVSDNFKAYKKTASGTISIIGENKPTCAYFEAGDILAIRHEKEYTINIEQADAPRTYDNCNILETIGIIKGLYINTNGVIAAESDSYILNGYYIAPENGYIILEGSDKSAMSVIYLEQYGDISNRGVGTIIPVVKGRKYIFSTYQADFVSILFEKKLDKHHIGITSIVQGYMTGNGGTYVDDHGVKLALQAEAGDTYRITTKDGYYITCLYYNGSSNPVMHFKDLKTVDIRINITNKPYIGIISTDENVTISPSDWEKAIDDFYRVEHRGNGEYDFIVAANDSSGSDKAIADLICDGVNDEYEINCAVNCNLSNNNRESAKILLLTGNYYIDSFHTSFNCAATQTFGKVGIEIRKFSNIKRNDVTIHGQVQSVQINKTTATLHVKQSIYESINEECSVIGTTRNGQQSAANGISGTTANVTELFIHNVNVMIYDWEKPIVGIDGAGFFNLGVEECYIGTENQHYNPDWNTYKDICNDEFIGIRGCTGSNMGYGAYIKRSLIFNCGQGLAVLGEHFIIEDVLMHSCKIAFTIGNYNISGKMEHPNIFIGCSIEKAYRIGIFNRYGATEEQSYEDYVAGGGKSGKETIIYIGGSSEFSWTDSNNESHLSLPILEIIKGAYRGRIETDCQQAIPLFEDGSGAGITVTKW